MSDEPESADQELVRRVLAGDEVAARLLFERHLPALRAKAHAQLPGELRGKVGASDVIQDAYLTAYLRLGDFEDRGDGSFGRWLRGILEKKVLEEVHRHLDVAKRDARRSARLRTGDADELPSPLRASPSEEVIAREDADELRRAIDSLPEDYAAVLRLVHLEGRTLVEAGERMGRSADAVRKTYGRALSRLAARMRHRRNTPA
jgi:RNA polymerase sigma-70 factor (ECF subfamily)